MRGKMDENNAPDVKAWLAEQEAIRRQAEENQKLQQELQAAKDRIDEIESQLLAEQKSREAEVHLEAVRELQPQSLEATNPPGTADTTDDEKLRRIEQHEYVRRVQYLRKTGIANEVANRLYFEPSRIANLPTRTSGDTSNFGGSHMWTGTASADPASDLKKKLPSGNDDWTPGWGGFAD
jgi:hypothetical protein